MSFKISGGVTEQDVVAGNVYDKYGSRNFLVRKIMQGFESDLSGLVARAAPSAIHEIGCGEGYWVLRWHDQGIAARGCDFSSRVIAMARENAASRGLPESLFETRSIYDIEAGRDGADLLVCCEVLEHLESPEQALARLRQVATGHLILSVPREPLWRLLNCARGAYLRHLGNTPGHVQHWSKGTFVRLVEKYFEIVEVRTPLPWTMVLCSARS